MVAMTQLALEEGSWRKQIDHKKISNKLNLYVYQNWLFGGIERNSPKGQVIQQDTFRRSHE